MESYMAAQYVMPVEFVRPDPACANCCGFACMWCALGWPHDSCVKDCPECCVEPHQEVLACVGSRQAQVDVGIKDEIEALWKHGIGTLYCCQGRPGEPRYVVLDNPSVEQVDLAKQLLPWVVTVDTLFDPQNVYLAGVKPPFASHERSHRAGPPTAPPYGWFPRTY